MKRLTWGIILASVGALCLLVSVPTVIDNPRLLIFTIGREPGWVGDAFALGFVLTPVGGFLIKYGAAALKRKQTIEHTALAMHKATGGVDPSELARKLSYNEMEVRRIVGLAQRDGLIPK